MFECQGLFCCRGFGLRVQDFVFRGVWLQVISIVALLITPLVIAYEPPSSPKP